jgi:hypothetical protein
MPVDPTAAERKRRFKLRQAGLLPPAVKIACTAPGCTTAHTGAHGLLCSRCWERFTSEGRADRAARVARFRARQAPANPSTEDHQ